MHRIEKTQGGRGNRLWEYICALGLTLALCLLPLAAWADDDDKPIPLDPQTKQAQLITFGVVGGLVLAVVIFYFVRRWQLMRSENYREGYERDQD